MGEKSVKCSSCGAELTAADEAALVGVLQAHAHDAHGMEMPDEKAKMAVAQGHT